MHSQRHRRAARPPKSAPISGRCDVQDPQTRSRTADQRREQDDQSNRCLLRIGDLDDAARTALGMLKPARMQVNVST